MKKNITTRQSPRLAPSASRQPMTIGLDLGDKTSRYCALNQQGEVAGEGSVATTRKAATESIQFGTEMAAPVSKSEDTNWHRSGELP